MDKGKIFVRNVQLPSDVSSFRLLFAYSSLLARLSRGMFPISALLARGRNENQMLDACAEAVPTL